MVNAMTRDVTARPIGDEADYDKALAEIERLFDAKLGTPEGERLDALVTLVVAYEQEHYPVGPPTP